MGVCFRVYNSQEKFPHNQNDFVMEVWNQAFPYIGILQQYIIGSL